MKGYDIKSKEEGGVFMFKNVNTVLMNTNSEFVRLGPSSFGMFMYSLCTTLDLTIEDTKVQCKNNNYVYATDL